MAVQLAKRMGARVLARELLVQAGRCGPPVSTNQVACGTQSGAAFTAIHPVENRTSAQPGSVPKSTMRLWSIVPEMKPRTLWACRSVVHDVLQAGAAGPFHQFHHAPLATESRAVDSKGIIDNPANLTQYRYETEHFCPICRSSELSQII